MHKNEIRKDKTCLNCGQTVDLRFCPNCGQENIDTRKSFFQLFVHFFEDLTHYENAFWKTIKNLLLKPASLTKEYLSGKRLSYLAPVRLYIFISFVTFLCFSIFYNSPREKTEIDSLDQSQKADFIYKTLGVEYKNIKELDDFQKKATPENKLSSFEYNIYKRLIYIQKTNTNKEIFEKFKESFIHNLPKLLFLYMPFFAFLLWLFHNKRKWYFFDHGIFTLHYFSFLLLILLVVFLVNQFITHYFDAYIINILRTSFSMISIFWMFYYFFPAHHRFYGGSRLKSILYGFLILFINAFFMSLFSLIYIIYNFLSIH